MSSSSLQCSPVLGLAKNIHQAMLIRSLKYIVNIDKVQILLTRSTCGFKIKNRIHTQKTKTKQWKVHQLLKSRFTDCLLPNWLKQLYSTWKFITDILKFIWYIKIHTSCKLLLWFCYKVSFVYTETLPEKQCTIFIVWK